jgi:hypothetical protein
MTCVGLFVESNLQPHQSDRTISAVVSILHPLAWNPRVSESDEVKLGIGAMRIIIHKKKVTRSHSCLVGRRIGMEGPRDGWTFESDQTDGEDAKMNR